MTESTLRGRRIVLSGATGILGRALTLALSHAGADLVLLGQQKRKLEQLDDAIASAGGHPPLLVPLDYRSADESHFAELAGNLAAEPLHGLVLTHGIHAGLQPLDHLPPKDWQNVLKINLQASFLLVHNLLPLLRASQGQLLGILQTTAAGRAFSGAYGVSQAAVSTLLKSAAEEAEGRVRVEQFDPGPMPSPIRHIVYPGETTEYQENIQRAVQRALSCLRAE